MASESVTVPAPSAPTSALRRSWIARFSQWKRTWYFLRRNTLAMVGLGILILFAVAFIYGITYSAPGTSAIEYCASDGYQTPVTQPGNPCVNWNPTICTYPLGSAPPGPNCYETPTGFPNFVPPTIFAAGATLGPLPFGSLVWPQELSNQPFFYNTYALLVKGTVNTLFLSVLIVAVGASSGLALGALSGYFGGWVDEVVMRITDIFLSIPSILLVIMVIIVGETVGLTTFDDRLWLIAAAFIVVWWPLYARIVRSQSLVVREQRYVEAARASGAGSGRILRKHVIPNSVYPVFVQMSLDVGSIPLLLAAIAFIGFVLFPSQLVPEWGSIAAAGVAVLPSLFKQCGVSGAACFIPWWQLLFPGLAIFFFAISVNFFADGLRDALDPRLRR
ncbi:MAG TPA: ABC transporter permease [Thermoplasmata archaeon]|nr:ABC transporter permease [Thermoplasmata archaeon]